MMNNVSHKCSRILLDCNMTFTNHFLRREYLSKKGAVMEDAEPHQRVSGNKAQL